MCACTHMYVFLNVCETMSQEAEVRWETTRCKKREEILGLQG